MTQSLWGGRFQSAADETAFQLNASIQFDRRMALQDVRGSKVWADALVGVGVLTPAENEQIQTGLAQIQTEFEVGQFAFHPTDEDIHTAVERRLTEIIGAVAGKLHTGRSRNDQVATDFRLWMLDALPQLTGAVNELQRVLVGRAETDISALMPGYTHLQRAQPILLSHWWMQFFWMLARDVERLQALQTRTATLPLGCGALAGAPFPVDREGMAEALGMGSVAQNSLDAVSNRDFAAEFLFVASMIAIHLSKLSEAMILYTSAEFRYFTLDDAYSTGSSLMPQKKNPDHFELARGKAGTIIGKLVGLLTTLKGLPSTYDKDLQEDKPPVFETMDTLLLILPVLAGALDTLTVHADRMEAAIDPSMLATDLADYLVGKGIPFREAHHLTGEAVRIAEVAGVTLADLSLDAYQHIHPVFGPDVVDAFDVRKSVARRSATGGTAPNAVRTQIERAKALLAEK
jgi:argininosuccinate lyase